MKGPAAGLPIGLAGKFRIVLLVFASVFVISLLFFSQHLTDQLLQRERGILDLFVRSLEYVANNTSSTGDFSFVLEVVRAIDFPIVQTNPEDVPIYWRNVDIDTAALSQEKRAAFFKSLLARMDSQNKPIRIALNDTLVVNYVHYGESELIRQLRWLPFVELAIAAVFMLVAYIGFSYIKRSEQSNIWVGMARETAHQLGTPLSSLIGWLDRLKASPPEGQQLQDTIQEMENDLERLNKVAARFSKIGSRPDLRQEDLREVIQEVITYIARRIPKSGKRIDLRIDTPGEFRASINRELFEWVVENLMKNALDAIDGPSGEIVFTLSQAGGRTTIDVTDSGKGIDPKLHKEVFRPGFSTKKRGWGLGLSLSKRIIEDYHRGKLYVKQSTPGNGTTFRIRLVT
jgi:signal transduction histidine kinase